MLATPITGIGLPHSKAWWPARARARATNSRATATPGTTRPTARRTASPSNCAAKTFHVEGFVLLLPPLGEGWDGGCPPHSSQRGVEGRVPPPRPSPGRGGRNIRKPQTRITRPGFRMFLRVEPALDGAHHLQRHGRLVLLELVDLERAHAMLGRERAAELLDRVVHQRVDALFLVLQEGLGVDVLGRLHVVVQVAVAQVAEVHQPHAGNLARQQRIGLGHEGRNARHGNRDVVLDVQALFGLRERNALADVPELVCLRKVLGHHCIGHAAVFESRFEQRLEARARMVFGFAVGVLEQHAVRHGFVADERHAQLRHVLVDQAQRKLAHHFEARKARAQVLVRKAQQRDRMVERWHRGPGRELRRGQRVELHRRCGDDAERAFAADHQVAQVVAGVVLAQAAGAFPDFALRRDHFEAQAQIARVAVANHLRAAGIGGKVAADGAAAFGGKAQREQEALLLRRFLQRLQDAAGLHRHREVGRVNGANRVEPLQAQHHLRAAVVGNGAHCQPGVAALRHDGRAGRGAGLDHVGHLLRVGGPHHGQRLAARALAPVLLVGGQGRLRSARAAHRRWRAAGR